MKQVNRETLRAAKRFVDACLDLANELKQDGDTNGSELLEFSADETIAQIGLHFCRDCGGVTIDECSRCERLAQTLEADVERAYCEQMIKNAKGEL